MTSVIDWVEDAARENIRFHIESAERIAARANTTLGFLTAGAAGSLAYALGGSPNLVPWAEIAFLLLAIWLFACAAALVQKCLRIGPIETPTNEPKHLMTGNLDLDVIRRLELENLQKRIRLNQERNEKSGNALNKIRFAALLGLAVFIGAVLWFQVASGSLCDLAAAAG